MLVPDVASSRKVMKPKNKLTIEDKVEGRAAQEEEEEGGILAKKSKKDKDENGNDVEEEVFAEEDNGEDKEEGKEKNENENEKIEVDDGDKEEDDDDEVKEIKEKEVVNKSHNIARAVVNSIMPWVKVFLLKDEKDHKVRNFLLFCKK